MMTPQTATARTYQWTRTDVPDASETLRLVRFDSGLTGYCADLDRETPYFIQITTGPGTGDDLVGLYDLDGERLDGAQFGSWDVVPASEDVPADVIDQIETGWDGGTAIVTRAA